MNPNTQPIPSATVVVVRDVGDDLQALLLQRNSTLTFAPGAWVFPGGRIDPADYPDDNREEILSAALCAASREAEEEAGLALHPKRLKLIDYFITPNNQPRRFATWFFIADGNHCDRVTIDGGEIIAYRWMTAAQALAEHRSGGLPLITPTRKTLERLATVSTVAEALALATLYSR
ncbi:MAG: NUDIX domain-containing protein [Gammaproteobacteria bacterium]